MVVTFRNSAGTRFRRRIYREVGSLSDSEPPEEGSNITTEAGQTITTEAGEAITSE